MSDAKDNPKDQPNSEQAFEEVAWEVVRQNKFNLSDTEATKVLVKAHQQAVRAAVNLAWRESRHSQAHHEAIAAAEVALLKKLKASPEWESLGDGRAAIRTDVIDAELEKRGAL